MIIYGWRSKTLKQGHLESTPCVHCNQQSTFITIVASYFHVFWIPMFPYRKKAMVHCGTCENETPKSAMKPDFAEQIKTFKSSVSLPIWMFVGLAIVAIFALYITIIG